MNVHEEVEFLREKVRQLEEILEEKTSALPPEWCLTETERRMVALLLRRDMVNDTQIIDAIYWDREPPMSNTLKVLMVRVRQKLKRHRVEINTQWGQGYYIPNRKEVLRKWNLQ